MEFQSQFFCTIIFVLISVIWYKDKKAVTDKNRNEREDSMTLLIKNNEEKEIQIKNLTEENHDLKKLISEQSEVINELYDYKKRVEDLEKSSPGERFLTTKKERDKINKYCEISNVKLSNLSPGEIHRILQKH